MAVGPTGVHSLQQAGFAGGRAGQHSQPLTLKGCLRQQGATELAKLWFCPPSMWLEQQCAAT